MKVGAGATVEKQSCWLDAGEESLQDCGEQRNCIHKREEARAITLRELENCRKKRGSVFSNAGMQMRHPRESQKEWDGKCQTGYRDKCRVRVLFFMMMT